MKSKFHILLLCFFLVSSNLFAQNKTKELAKKAIDLWQIGEKEGNYSLFTKEVDSTHFSYFSHPFVGNLKGKEAYKALKKLIADRTINPNSLLFTNHQYFINKHKAVVIFNSKGTAGKIKYDGPIAIQFEFLNNKIIGFTEYIGLINPDWFK